MNDNNTINKLENLRKIRESKNITQLKLATDLGVTQELISRYELGSSFPQPSMLIKLANYFNCSVDYLLGLTNITTPIRYIFSDIKTLENSELLNKYNSLSKEDKKYFDKFLTFLIDNSSKEQ